MCYLYPPEWWESALSGLAATVGTGGAAAVVLPATVSVSAAGIMEGVAFITLGGGTVASGFDGLNDPIEKPKKVNLDDVDDVTNSTRSSSGAQIIRVNNPGGGRNITQVQVSPGGGRHGDLPYVKISTDAGRIKVIDGPASSYNTDGLEKALNLFTE